MFNRQEPWANEEILMVVGDLVVLCNCQTTGYKNGEIGIVTKIEDVGELFKLYWVFMSDGVEVPMWNTELEVFNGSRRPYNNFKKPMGHSSALWLQEWRHGNGVGDFSIPRPDQPAFSKSIHLCLREDSYDTNNIHIRNRRLK